MHVQELDDLVIWFKGNVLNTFKLPPESIIYDDEVEDGALHESALLYKWCDRRKRLVRSN